MIEPRVEGIQRLRGLCTGVVAIICVAGTGCITTKLENEWDDILIERSSEDLELSAHFPADGDYSVGLAVRPYAFTNRRFIAPSLPTWNLWISGPGQHQA